MEIKPSKVLVGVPVCCALSNVYHTMHLRVLPRQRGIYARATSRGTGRPYAEVVIVANLCNKLRFQHISVAYGKAGNGCCTSHHGHLEAVRAASLYRKRKRCVRNHIHLRLCHWDIRDNRRRCGCSRTSSRGAAGRRTAVEPPEWEPSCFFVSNCPTFSSTSS